MNDRFGPPPTLDGDVSANIDDRSPLDRRAPRERKDWSEYSFLNCRVPKPKHVEIKMAALKAGMTLSDYLLMCHAQYQRTRR